MGLFIDDDFWKQFGDIKGDVASSNKVFPENGVGFIYGLPASRKTTIAIDTIKSMKNFDGKYYIDCDSKSIAQAKDTYSNLTKHGFHYRNSLLEGLEPKDVINSILDAIVKENDNKPRCLIVDTWHQLIQREDKNEDAKDIMKRVREVSQKHNLLIVFVAHVGKSSDDIRGASSVSGDATFKVLVSKTGIDSEYSITITKDSLGLLSDSTAIITKESSISDSVIEYSSEIKEEINTMKPKDASVTATLVKYMQYQLKNNNRIKIGDLRDWLYDNYNKTNNFKPEHPLFCSNRFLKDNFVDFTESLFSIEREGRSKYVVDFLYEEDKGESDE